jgi:sn-glycerol 3-phosphate transport system substrate-binding protein
MEDIMMKLFKSLLAVGLAIMLVAGCANGAPSPEATPSPAPVQSPDTQNPSTDVPERTPPPEPVELQFWHHMEGVSAEGIADIVDLFNETIGAERNITVEHSFHGWNMGEKLNTLAQANDWRNFPDVAQLASGSIPQVMDYEMLVTTDEMWAEGSETFLSRDRIVPTAARTFAYMGEQIGIPFSNSAILLYYNKDAFEEVGLDPNKPPATVAEMSDYASRLMIESGRDERNGLVVQISRYQLVNFVGGQGSYNFLGDNEGGRSDMMTRFTFGEDGSLMKFLDEWEKLIATGAYKPIEDNINEEFAMQSTAMAIMSSARITRIENLVGDSFRWGTAPLPTVSASDRGGTAVGGSGIVMFDHGDPARKEAAWIFKQFLGGIEAQNIFCQKSGYIPINLDVYDTDDWKSFVAANDVWAAPVHSLLTSHPNVQEPFDLVPWEVNDIIREEMAIFGQGQQDKQTTHDNIVTRCNAAVAEYVRVNR